MSRKLAALPIALLAACVGSGEGLDLNGRPLKFDAGLPDAGEADAGEDAGSGSNPRANLGWIQQNVFTPICAQCHIGAAAPKGLSLEAAVAHDNLINVPSVEVPEILRVKPADPANSYLMVKIVPTDPRRVGERMPRSGPPYLTDEQIEAIRQWISLGAARQ
ncbi:MAG: hypothetical protein HYZ28_29145 [Myxococcales bacterium]|nr:hypothetical protein [Myxococcales bacterium]